MKTPNEYAETGGYITIPVVQAKRWNVITGYIKCFNFQIGAELGVADAVNYTHLMKLNPTLRLYGIDSYEEEGNELETYKGGLYADGQNNRKTNAEKLPSIYPERSRIIVKRTDEAHKDIPDGHLDFVFIDADHTYEGVKRDIELWEPKVHENGLIIGHDLNWGGVARAVGEKFSNFWISADNVWASPKYWYNAIRT